MKIKIVEQGNIHFDTKTSKKMVVIGRGSQSDFVVKNDHISRAHIKILNKDDGVYLENLTTNWCFLNNKNIFKGKPFKILSTDTIELPGGVYISIEKLKEDVGYDFKKKRSLERVSAKSSIGKRKQRQEGASEHLEALKGLIPFIFVLFLVGGYIYYKQLDEPKNESQLTNYEKLQKKRKIQKWKKIRRTRSLIDKRVVKLRKVLETDQVKKLIDETRCRTKTEGELCQLLLNYGKDEGFLVRNNTAYAFLDFNKRTDDHFNDDVYPALKNIPKEILFEVIVSHYFLKPSFLKEIKEFKGINKIVVHVIDTSDIVHETLKTYMIDLSDTLNHTEVKHHIAMNGILKKRNPDFFENYLRVYLLEVN